MKTRFLFVSDASLSYTKSTKDNWDGGSKLPRLLGEGALPFSESGTDLPTYAYLHGFASSPLSHKGIELEKRFNRIGLEFLRPDLNVPSFSELTYTAALQAIDSFFEDQPRPLRFVGSSMGGYLAARWAELNPDDVDKLVLLCPGFALTERWPDIVGIDAFDRWREFGSLEMEDARGEAVPVHWGFIEDAMDHPAVPQPQCPITIVHGIDDVVVPIESSRKFARRESVKLVEVDDDHGLANSIDIIFEACRERFQLT